MNMLIRSLAILALGLIGFAPNVAAQRGWEIGAGAGIAAPIGGASEQRHLGPHFFLSVGYQLSSQIQLRGDYTWSELSGQPHPESNYPPSLSTYGDLRLSGFSANFVIKPTVRMPIQPYAFVGAGGYAMRNLAGVRNPYGQVPGVSVGAGANVGVRQAVLFTEARIETLLSDFGASDASPTAYVPVAAGVRIPLSRSMPH
jgi:hypothetical protein